jgi:hypothetical protein
MNYKKQRSNLQPNKKVKRGHRSTLRECKRKQNETSKNCRHRLAGKRNQEEKTPFSVSLKIASCLTAASRGKAAELATPVCAQSLLLITRPTAYSSSSSSSLDGMDLPAGNVVACLVACCCDPQPNDPICLRPPKLLVLAGETSSGVVIEVCTLSALLERLLADAACDPCECGLSS